MDDSPAPTPGQAGPPPTTPPAPTYQAPPPVAPPPASPPSGAYPPAVGYAPPAPPKKKKTWLWIVLGIVLLGLLGCCAAAALGGFALFKGASEPSGSIDALNQAALDGDREAYERYFDAAAVSDSAYEDFIAYVKGTEDYTALVTELGDEEADRVLREEVMPREQFVQDMAAEFDIDSLDDGQVPFPDYTVSSSSVDNDTAELTIVTVEDGENVTYVLGLVQETIGEEKVWRIIEIKNIAEMLEDEGA